MARFVSVLAGSLAWAILMGILASFVEVRDLRIYMEEHIWAGLLFGIFSLGIFDVVKTYTYHRLTRDIDEA